METGAIIGLTFLVPVIVYFVLGIVAKKFKMNVKSIGKDGVVFNNDSGSDLEYDILVSFKQFRHDVSKEIRVLKTNLREPYRAIMIQTLKDLGLDADADIKHTILQQYLALVDLSHETIVGPEAMKTVFRNHFPDLEDKAKFESDCDTKSTLIVQLSGQLIDQRWYINDIDREEFRDNYLIPSFPQILKIGRDFFYSVQCRRRVLIKGIIDRHENIDTHYVNRRWSEFFE